MHPEGWGDFYNVHITVADPAGLAVVGQTVFAESGPEFLHPQAAVPIHGDRRIELYKLGIRCTISIWRHCAGRHGRLYSAWDSNSVVSTTTAGSAFQQDGAVQCCTFLHAPQAFDSGPADSRLARLQRAAERLYAESRGVLSARGQKSSQRQSSR